MFSIRLTDDLEQKISRIADYESTTKSDVVKEALVQYIKGYHSRQSLYESGEELFGRYGSGRSDLSGNYKSLLKEKFRAKRSH